MIAPTITQTLESLRKDFPILTQEVRPGVPLIYLDSAATSQKPLSVLEAEDHFYREINANVHRGVHSFSEKATAAYEGARVKAKQFLNARSAREIIFTRNTTEAINLVAYAWGLSELQPGDEIILTEMEHHANLVSWQIIAKRQGAVIRYIPVTDDGRLDLSVYDQLLTSGRVKLVSVAHVSNVLGTVNPVAEIIRKAHAIGALTMLDAAQSTPHIPVDVQALDVDFLAFSGHKLLGPTGIGVLYGKREVLEAMPPFMGGGSMINDVSLDGTTFADIPQRFEAGTPPIAQAIALGAALDYLQNVGLDNVHAHELALTEYAISKLKDIPGLVIFGPQTDRIGVISFTLKGVHPHDIAQGLDSAGIAIRAGHHCAQPLHKRFHLPATARASFYLYNTVGEVDKFVETLEKLRALLARRG